MIRKLHSKVLLQFLTINSLRQGATCGSETFLKHLKANIRYNKYDLRLCR